MICGVIDIGSNSVLLVVGDGERIILDTDRVTRLGEGLTSFNRLTNEAMDRTASVVCEFKKIACEIGAKRVIAVGTMALRMAENARDFIKLIRNKCSLDVRVLSGKEEAILSFRGAVQSLNLKGKLIVSDIGGRSTEISVGKNEKAEFVKSFNIGALTLMERFSVGYNPIPPDVVKKMVEFSRETFAGLDLQGDYIVGIGGTMTNLAAIKLKLKTYDPDAVHGLLLSYDEIYRIVINLASMTLEKRRKTTGLQPERADTIVPGSSIILGLMQALGFDKIIVSDRALRHALLKECSLKAFSLSRMKIID